MYYMHILYHYFHYTNIDPYMKMIDYSGHHPY